MRIFLSRIWGLFRGRRPDDELNHEVGFHLAMLEDEFRARGFTDSEAKMAARREFGGVTQIQEEYRERSGIRWLEVAVKDVRFGVRILAKKPGFTLAAILALALGIGPNTALFSIVYAAFFDSIGYPDPDRLVTVEYQGKGGGANRLGIAPGDFLEFQRENAVFESLSALRGIGGVYSSGEMEQPVWIASATPGYISRTCGLQPLLGRDFFPEEAEPGNDGVIILSHRFWDAYFGKDPAIVGQKIRLNAKLYTVIGVMPPSKAFGGNEFQMLVPGKPDPRAHPQHGQPGPYVWGRLKAGVSLAQATAEMNRVAQNLAREYPATNQGLSIRIEPVRNSWVPARTKTTIWLLAGAVAFVLLIACANLASLMLARGTTRQREIAIRASLGASGGRLFVQLLIESLIIAVAGCALGCGFGWFLLRILITQVPAAALTAEVEPSLNVPVLLFTAAVGVCAGALFGSVPAWRTAHRNMAGALKMSAGADSGRHHLRLRRCLVVLQFAAAMTLLAGASLCVHSLWRKASRGIGIDKPENILVFTCGGLLKFAQAGQWTVESRNAVAAIESLPGVRAAAASDQPPLVSYPNMPLEVTGLPADARPTGNSLQITGRYFETYGIRVTKGRSFDDRDRAGAELVAMVNEEFVRRYLSGRDPFSEYVGVRVMAPDPPARFNFIRHRIVGIYQDVKRSGTGNPSDPEVVVPAAQENGFTFNIAVRTSADPMSLRKPILDVLRSAWPDVQMLNVTTVDKMAGDKVARERAYAVLFGLLAGLALVLSGVGIYGVMAFLVAQRTKEIGLRIALGAAPGRIAAMIFREGATLVALGVVLGLIGVSFAGGILQAQLNDAPKIDYVAFSIATALLLVCALAACCGPAFRASEVNPIDSLRLD